MNDPKPGQFVVFDGVLIGYIEDVKSLDGKKGVWMVRIRTHLAAHMLKKPRQVGFADGMPFSIEIHRAEGPPQAPPPNVATPDKGILDGFGRRVG